MNYRQTTEFLFNQLPAFHRIGAPAYKADLSKTILLDRILGNPARSLKVIHVAGTNGKGSVSSFLASILQCAGYKTGLFTSPHLLDFRERIRVNGMKIPKTTVTSFINKHLKEFTEVQPSFFEITFALASGYFSNGMTDVAVIETGMGGRLDSTNIVNPEVTVITNISNDHSQFLGNTPEKIAAEKAGIIKPLVPVIIGEYQPEVYNVFTDRAEKLQSPLFVADQNFRVKAAEYNSRYCRLECSIIRKNGALFADVSSPLSGIYQLKNLLTVAQATDILSKRGYKISPQNFAEGIKKVLINTGFAGRWQKIMHDPQVYCDIAHNEDGIRELLRQISSLNFRNLHFVFGMVEDKDYGKILCQLPKDAAYYYCKPSVPRGMNAEELEKIALNFGFKGKSFASVKEALSASVDRAQHNDLIIVTGSTFVVADALAEINRR